MLKILSFCQKVLKQQQQLAKIATLHQSPDRAKLFELILKGVIQR
jgi:hypothetical protein